jgi:prolyl-tRNA editing enzyme YbaK/EbsC (Cys-tRNA(Pro) deacylase)
MAAELTATAQRVQDALAALGVANQVVELPASTRSAAEAAQAIGCRVEQIAKSLVFRGLSTDRPILAIVSGANRVDEERLGELIAEGVAKADADYVRQRTGFAIGGVPPVGHVESLMCLIDEDLFWAAGGDAACGVPADAPGSPADHRGASCFCQGKEIAARPLIPAACASLPFFHIFPSLNRVPCFITQPQMCLHDPP